MEGENKLNRLKKGKNIWSKTADFYKIINRWEKLDSYGIYGRLILKIAIKKSGEL